MARSHVSRTDRHPNPSGREAARIARWRRDASWRSLASGMPWVRRERPICTPGKEGQASSVAAPIFGGPAETKKARSVVALSRVPHGGRGPPVSPLTVSPRVREGDASRGGSPASCPDAHRPTRGHRHVRVWARLQISARASRFKRFVERSRRAGTQSREVAGPVRVSTLLKTGTPRPPRRKSSGPTGHLLRLQRSRCCR